MPDNMLGSEYNQNVQIKSIVSKFKVNLKRTVFERIVNKRDKPNGIMSKPNGIMSKLTLSSSGLHFHLSHISFSGWQNNRTVVLKI